MVARNSEPLPLRWLGAFPHGPLADSDESSRRFRLKPATCSDGSQPVIPTKPAGVVEQAVSG